jgi:hypothetical protein
MDGVVGCSGDIEDNVDRESRRRGPQMPQEVVLANSMRQAIVTIPNQPREAGGAQWPANMPHLVQTQSNDPKPKRLPVTLPVGGTLVISFRRTNVNPQADVNVQISRDANGVHVANTPTDANNLSVSIQQSGGAGNEQVIITFKGHETNV